MTQTEAILAWLKDGKSITALDALSIFQCFRLAARIADIRAQGFTVHTEMVQTRTGKTVASYSLDQEDIWHLNNPILGDEEPSNVHVLRVSAEADFGGKNAITKN